MADDRRANEPASAGQQHRFRHRQYRSFGLPRWVSA
jgi:hypothetical protein